MTLSDAAQRVGAGRINIASRVSARSAGGEVLVTGFRESTEVFVARRRQEAG
ncbi:MAG: hypothetical protein ACRDPM_24625 [Solirubrobacteraceae bacterium]